MKNLDNPQKQILQGLTNFEIAVNKYRINPSLPINRQGVREAYQEYLSVKQGKKIPEGLKQRESGLIKEIKELIK